MMKYKRKEGRRSQGQNGEAHKFPVLLSSQGPLNENLQDDTLQPKPNGRCKVDRARRAGTTEIYLGSYNTRTLRTEDDLEHLLDEINQIKWNIIGLCETKRKGEGLTELPGGTWLFECNKTEERPNAKGMAFLVHKNFKDYIEEFKIHSERVISCKIKLEDKKSLQIINVYAPTSTRPDEEVETLYDTIENAFDRQNCRYHIIIGDFNAKVGQKKSEKVKSIGRFGLGDRNERGEMLINFAQEQGLYLMNTFFKKQKDRYWTWESPDKETRNQIDYTLASNKNIIANCEIISKVNIGSDHRMLRTKVKINKKLIRLKRILRQKPMKTNLALIEANKNEFELQLKNRFQVLKTTPDIDTLHTIVLEEADKVSKGNNRQKEKTDEDKTIEDIDMKRRNIYNKERKTAKEKIEYAELNKTLKKLRRKRARERRKQMIMKVIEQGKGPKEINKNTKKKKITTMYKEDGEETNNREEILKICADFYKNLYRKTMEAPVPICALSQNTEKVPEFTVKEVMSILTQMKKRKAPGNDRVTSDILLMGGKSLIKYLTRAYNEILRTHKIPESWKEAKVIILFKKGSRKEIKNYRPISLLAHTYKLFTRLLQDRMEEALDTNQPREQAGFRRKFSTIDHLQALNQTIEKCNEYNKTLCIGFIDYEKAFDSVEHFSIFDSLRKININETYVKILENIYKEATARIHLDNHVSEAFRIERGVRQGDPISPKLFTTAIEEVFRRADLKEGITIDGEELKDLRFADDVALCTTNTEQMESHLNILNKESKKIGLKIHKGKTKYMTNFVTKKAIQVENEVIEEVDEYKYLGQTISPSQDNNIELNIRIRSAWTCFGKNKEIFLDPELPLSLKGKVFNMCILPSLTYGCETWKLTKQQMNKIRTTQWAMERRMLDIRLTDKIPHKTIRKRTKLIDAENFIKKMKWRWAGHIGRQVDNRWTRRCTEWKPHGSRRPGRPKRRWSEDIVGLAGEDWMNIATNRDEWRIMTEGFIQQWMYDA